jgi:hypothetical protein
LIEWDDEETTYEPLYLNAQDDPITCADYAKQNKLLNTAGWKHFLCVELDKKNNKTRWQEAEAAEMGQSLEYKTFVDKCTIRIQKNLLSQDI